LTLCREVLLQAFSAVRFVVMAGLFPAIHVFLSADTHPKTYPTIASVITIRRRAPTAVASGSISHPVGVRPMGRQLGQLPDAIADHLTREAQFVELLQIEPELRAGVEPMASRSAVSAVTPRWPLMMAVIRFTGTSIWRETSAAEMPSSLSSSARCSPG
jgi:hypothetical protein